MHYIDSRKQLTFIIITNTYKAVNDSYVGGIRKSIDIEQEFAAPFDIRCKSKPVPMWLVTYSNLNVRWNTILIEKQIYHSTLSPKSCPVYGLGTILAYRGGECIIEHTMCYKPNLCFGHRISTILFYQKLYDSCLAFVASTV